MKCFHFSNGENRRENDDEDGNVSRTSKVSWARSFSVASSSVDASTRRSEFDSVDSRDLSDSVGFYEFLRLRRANDLRVFRFSELKSATRGFSKALLIGEGGFGCVYRGVVRDLSYEFNGDPASKLDVAIKQLNRSGFQACPFVPFMYSFNSLFLFNNYMRCQIGLEIMGMFDYSNLILI